MLRIVSAVILASFFTPELHAQDLQGKVSCWGQGSLQPQNRAHTKELWDGYEISLGPTPHAADNPEQACTAAVYNRGGHVVFRTTGFSVIFDENHTGQDFDNDGKPEVVFMTDSGGGNHCCWAYNVISLSPKPHKLFDIDAPGAIRFEKDKQGRMVIWQLNAATHEFTSEANTPFAEKVLRVHEGKLVDVTPEFCWRIFSDPNEDNRAWKGDLAPEKIKKLQSTANMRGEDEEIASALLSRALQNVFCQRFDAALNDLNLWPEATRTKMKAAFAESIKQDYPEFAARLTSPPQGAAARRSSLEASPSGQSTDKSASFLKASALCPLTEIFSGEVKRGEEYDHILSNSSSLTFHLRAVEKEGWWIEILPNEAGPGGKRRDWAWPLNPPYHGYNAQNVSVSYDFTAKDVIEYGPREFRFPLNQADAERALRLYDRLQSSTGDQLQEAMNELETFPSGKGLFEITNFQLGPSGPENQQRGGMDWLKFRVSLTLSCRASANKP